MTLPLRSLSRIGQPCIALACILLLITGCAVRSAPGPRPHPPSEARARELARMGYTVQVGAFSKVENASRLTDALRKQGHPLVLADG